jgi:hypothetical protein
MVYEQDGAGLVQTAVVEGRLTNMVISTVTRQAPKQSSTRSGKRSKPDDGGGGRSGDRVMYVDAPVYDPEAEEPSKARRTASVPGIGAAGSPARAAATAGLAGAASAAAPPPAALVTAAREGIIQVLATEPRTEDDLVQKVGEWAGADLARTLLKLVARPNGEGRFELLDDPSLWAVVNVNHPELSEVQRARIVRQQARLGLAAPEERKAQLMARHSECRAEYAGLREQFASLYKQLRQAPTAEAANEALRLYDLHRDRLAALLYEARSLRAQLK